MPAALLLDSTSETRCRMSVCLGFTSWDNLHSLVSATDSGRAHPPPASVSGAQDSPAVNSYKHDLYRNTLTMWGVLLAIFMEEYDMPYLTYYSIYVLLCYLVLCILYAMCTYCTILYCIQCESIVPYYTVYSVYLLY